jgi:hypothetical protein
MESFFEFPPEILGKIYLLLDSFKDFVRLMATTKKNHFEQIPSECFTRFIETASHCMSRYKNNKLFVTKLTASIVVPVPPRMHLYKDTNATPPRLYDIIHAIIANDPVSLKFMLNFKLETNLYCSLSALCRIFRATLHKYEGNAPLLESCKKRFDIFMAECKENLESDCSGACRRSDIVEYFDMHYHKKPKPDTKNLTGGQVDRMNGSGCADYVCDDPLPIITLLIAPSDEICAMVFNHIAALLDIKNTQKSFSQLTPQPYYLIRSCVQCSRDSHWYKHGGLFSELVKKIDSLMKWNNQGRCRIDSHSYDGYYFKYKTT